MQVEQVEEEHELEMEVVLSRIVRVFEEERVYDEGCLVVLSSMADEAQEDFGFAECAPIRLVSEERPGRDVRTHLGLCALF